ncbi:MAG: YDG domain-containing protein [Firmicutes bacterium]|nr:YDG domain-containing protein [Bacillota bacterium]
MQRKKTLSWLLILSMIVSYFTGIPKVVLAAEAPPKNIYDADVLPDGKIAVLYLSDGKIIYGVLDPSSNNWRKEEIGAGKDAALTVDGSGFPHIVYITSSDDLGYTYFTGSSWSDTETIDSIAFGGVDGLLTSPDIVVDASGFAHISYLDAKGGYTGGNNYTSYDKEDLVYATNASGTFVRQIISYSHGWFYSPDGWRNFVHAPTKIVHANDSYGIGVKQYNYDKWMTTQYHTYNYDLFTSSSTLSYPIRSATSNNDLGFKLFDMGSDGTNIYSLFKKSSTLYLTNGVNEITAATKAFTGNAADLFVMPDNKAYYAGILSNNLLLYQNGDFKESLTLPAAISTSHLRMATVVSNNKQYVFYTDTAGSLWVCDISTNVGDVTVNSFEIPDKLPVTISGVNVVDKTYDGNAVAFAGTPAATVTDSGETVSIAQYDYTWYDVTNGVTLTSAPLAAGSYKLIVAVAETDSTYTGSVEIPFSIGAKSISISGVAATNRPYNGATSVEITGGTLNGVVNGDLVNAHVPASGTVDSADAGDGKAVTSAAITLSGADADNYLLTQPTGITVNITKAPVTISTVSASDKTYDGFLAATVTGVTFSGLQNGETLALATDYSATGSFQTTNVGTAKAVTGTVTLLATSKANNYSLADTAFATSANITKASGFTASDPADLAMIKEQIQGYSFDLSTLGLNKTDTGSVSYGLGALTGDALFSANPAIAADGKTLTFTSADVSSGTATQVVTISTQNYHDTTATLTVVLVDKTAVTISGVSVANKTYDGNAIAFTGTPTATVTGSGAVSIDQYDYTWYDVTNSATLPSAPLAAGSYKLIVTVAESDSAYTGMLEVPFSISKKNLTIKPQDYTLYCNDEFPDLALVAVGLVAGDELASAVSFSEPLTLAIEDLSGELLNNSSLPGHFPIVFTNEPMITSANYTVVTGDGMLTILRKDPVVIHFQLHDGASGITISGLETNVYLPEKDEDDVESVLLRLQATNAGNFAGNLAILTLAEATLTDLGYNTFNAFDISLIKTVTKLDGSSTEVTLPSSAITGPLTIRIAIPLELLEKTGLAVAYIDELGNVEILASQRVTINGIDYLEFVTDHLSIYTIVELIATEQDGELPRTGGTNRQIYLLLVWAIVGFGLLLLQKKRALKQL